MAPQCIYRVWMRHCPGFDGSLYGGPWTRTCHTATGRTPKEARSRMLRKFRGGGFHNMSLIAAPLGMDPNMEERKRAKARGEA